MDVETLRQLIEGVSSGSIAPDEAVERLKRLPFSDVGDTLVDHHRHLRQGAPEAVYGPGKSPEQCVLIVRELLDHGTGPVLVTRTTTEQQQVLQANFGVTETANGSMLWRAPQAWYTGNALVISAGTADVPVVDECILALRAHGIAANRITDVGVAGLHRLLNRLDDVMAADVIVVVAGMEGALFSVVAGLVAAPVIALPTSVGYGVASGGGVALNAALSSCAPGVMAMNIDNGFGAAYAAAQINRLAQPAR